MLLVFIVRKYHDARSFECQINYRNELLYLRAVKVSAADNVEVGQKKIYCQMMTLRPAQPKLT